jgi:hypothetical protein
MTFHVRLISLPSQTSGLVEALTSEAGVSNLAVLPGTAQLGWAAMPCSSTWRPGPRTRCSGS